MSGPAHDRRRGGPAARRVAAAVAAVLLLSAAPCAALTLARRGRAEVAIRVAREASPAERTAAAELRGYLEAVTGARFELVEEGEGAEAEAGILVGPTAAARRAGTDPAALGPEEWIISASGRRLLLYGGRPRGTLYAVYRFLEEHVGVRWWAPGEERVPSRPTLRIPAIERRGSPAFAYRDVFGAGGRPEFRARGRLNGHFSALGVGLGGSWRYGPPRPAHTFYDYVPPEELFEAHPGFFSELAGVRYGGRGQLCLTDPDLPELLAGRLQRYVEAAEREAELRGEPPPALFSFSQNDWGNPCQCARCRAAARRAGSAAGPLAQLLNRLADAIRETHPEVLLDTLAYMHTLSPPAGPRLRDNVVVRLSALQIRDFARPLSAAEHEAIRRAIEGWLGLTRHLWVWDYGVTYGPNGDLPLPGLRVLASDLRYYARVGVEGVLVQHDYPVAADMRSLELWVLFKLLEDPGRDLDALIERFTRGYYGRAGGPLRRYLRELERQAAAHPARIGFRAPADAYGYLDGPFLLRAQALFDRAESRTDGDPALLRRVRHARLALDRATLWRWDGEFGFADEASGGRRGALRRSEAASRYRATWFAEIERQYPPEAREAARAEVEREIAYLDGMHRSSAEGR